MRHWRTTITYFAFVFLVLLGTLLVIGWQIQINNWGVLFVGLLFASLVIAVAFVYRTDSALAPYRQLTAVVGEIADGSKTVDSLPDEQSEVGQLAQAFRSVLAKRQRQVRKKNRESDRLLSVMTYMADGALMLSRRGKVRLINPAACRLLATDEKDAIGRTFAQVVREHQIVNVLQKCIETEEEEIEALELADDRFIRVVVTPFIKGSARGYLIILQNLTRMRNLQTMRRDFVSNVSHELRTPLASLRALTETLQDGAINDPPAADRFLRLMGVEIEKLTQMVQELLELSKIESGQMPLELAEVPAYDVISTSVERLQPQAERAGLELTIDVVQELPNVELDSNRIQQVLVNLLHNAIKFTPPEGQITVSAKCQGDRMTIAVADTGAGIPREDLPRIFERFYKTDRARTGGGSGLGLAIAKHIVLAHHGEIWAESVEGVGSTFYFALPTLT